MAPALLIMPQYILGNNEYYSVLNLAENIPQVIVIMILAPFIKKFGKRNLVLAGAVLTMVAQLTLLAVPANPTFVAVIAAIRGIGKAPFFGCVFTMMADVVNYGHWKTGVRVQALIFSAATVGQKFGGRYCGADCRSADGYVRFYWPGTGNPVRSSKG